jgi:hypothetical protein
LTFNSQDGIRTFNFASTYAVLKKAGNFTVWFPPIGHENADELYQWGVKLEETFTRKSGPGTYDASFTAFSKGKHGTLGCYRLPNLPGGGFGDPEDVGQIKITEFGSTGGFFPALTGSASKTKLNAIFRSPSYTLQGDHPDTVSEGGRKATIRTTKILEIKNHDLQSGNHCKTNGKLQSLNTGYVVHHPGQKWLRVSVQGKDCATNFVIQNFPAKPGLYIGSTAFDTVDFYIIDSISKNHVKGQKRVVKKENFPGKNTLTVDEARELGTVKIQFDIGEIIRHPKLEPVIIEE